jgi:hypothetical protein
MALVMPRASRAAASPVPGVDTRELNSARAHRIRLPAMLLEWLRQRQSGFSGLFGPVRNGAERRTAPRYDVHIEVWLRQHGLAPVAGSVINISRSGAAIRVHGWNVPVPSAWPTRLNHGDEVWLTGLLDVPLSCWVIAVEDGVLRVHFSLEEAMRHQLREVISALPHDAPAHPR